MKKRTGFAIKAASREDGMIYTEGHPTTIKADMKDGVFRELAQKTGGKKALSVQILKVVPLHDLCLYPFNEKEPRKNDWLHIFFTDSRGEIFQTLIRSYSLGEFRKMEKEMVVASEKLGVTVDYTTTNVQMVIEEKIEKQSKYRIKFYFCANGDGEPCSYLKSDGTPSKSAKVIELSDDDYDRNAAFAEAGGLDTLYDVRTAKEMVKEDNGNYDTSNLPDNLRSAFPYYILALNGYYPQTYFEDMATRTSAVTDSFIKRIG